MKTTTALLFSLCLATAGCTAAQAASARRVGCAVGCKVCAAVDAVCGCDTPREETSGGDEPTVEIPEDMLEAAGVE